MDTIKNVIDNNYRFKEGTKELEGADGIWENVWENEWKNFGKEYGIEIDELTIREITLRIYSLAHKIQYDDKKGHKGNIDLFIDGPNDSIALAVTEESGKKPYVSIAKYKGYKFRKNYCDTLLLTTVVCTKRVEHKLLLFVGYDTIVECIS